MVYKGVAHNDPLVIILIRWKPVKTLWALTQPHLQAILKPCTHGPACQPSASLCPPMPAGQSPSTPLGNSQIGKSGKAISPKPNLGGTAAQFGSLPNEEWTERLSNNGNHAPNSVNEFGCMKKTKLALCQCKLGSSQTFSIASHPSQSRKGNNRCNSDSWFPNSMLSNNHALQVH
ncbi:hypothetical protein DSO57_1026528 [Entomophthora muscae]|uniref:Uncharacterized protein n=1 Tax=Entomophthora muscae TaxID=34485 RepID=A0ACC2T2G4_9FUNG|nr:hypothetical protein DSO57_1026528 [Entomophthora muscae]